MVTIEGLQYFTAADAARLAGVSRQSLWRWRTDGLVAPGRKYRDRQILYTRPEVEQIREYAHRLEPLAVVGATKPDEQMRLFGAEGGKRHE